MTKKSSTEKPTIEQVKAKYEMQLLNVEGVQGVGIGDSEDRDECVIKVYVDKRTKSLREKIPEQIEGYPVKIETTGEFHAF